MEYDILNEIITGAVSNLFRPPPSFHKSPNTAQNFEHAQNQIHQQPKSQASASLTANYTKPDSSPNIFHAGKTNTGDFQKFDNKREFHNKSLDSLNPSKKIAEPSLQKSTSINIEQEPSYLQRGKEKSTAEVIINPPVEEQKESKQQTAKMGEITLDQWMKKEGPRRLNESLTRLNYLNAENLTQVNLSTLSAKQLEAEKRNVKNELKRYDSAFKDLFKRMPSRSEKEPMRPLYIFYKRLKELIGDEEKGSIGDTSTQQNSHQMSVDSEKLSRQNNAGLERNRQLNLSAGNPGKKVDNSFEEDFHRDRRNGGSLGSLGAFNSKQEPVKKPERSLSREEVIKKLEILDAVKTQMREKLHSYQIEFTKNNNRKIKYHKDIVPVEEEYKRYKEVKDEMAALENILKSL